MLGFPQRIIIRAYDFKALTAFRLERYNTDLLFEEAFVDLDLEGTYLPTHTRRYHESESR
jgi:hypothetical protein